MRLLVPYQAVSQPSIKELVIHQPERCSHCDAVPAPRTETHAVVIKTDAIPHRQIGKKYRNQIRLLVRLPLCETCYYKKYLTSSDTYTRDDTPLGAQSRQHEKLANTGGILAGLAILLLTPFIPASGFLVVLKTYWYVLLILGVVLLVVTWGMQKVSQSRVRRKLDELHGDSKQYSRADVWAESITGIPDPAATAVNITIPNEGWLRDSARLNGWHLEE